MHRTRQIKISPKTSPALERIGQTDREYINGFKNYADAFSGTPSPNYISTIYLKDPIVPFLGVAKTRHDLIETSKNLGAKRLGFPEAEGRRLREYFSILESKDLFSAKIGGTSLADVEKMELPLADDDIRRINRMIRRANFGGFNLSRLSSIQKWVQDTMVILPIQTLARSKDFHLPNQLKPLNDRLTSYFDYYVPFLVNPRSIDNTELQLFLLTSLWSGWHFQDGLSGFVPARLGLTPSSVIKLYKEAVRSYVFGGRFFKSSLEPAARISYKPGALPEELGIYLHQNDAVDKKAVIALTDHYENGKPALPENGNQDLDTLLLRARRYQQVLRADILKSKEKYLRVSLNHPLLDHVLLTNQYQYKQTLIVIAKFLDQQTHLTLEINGDGNLYGLPVGLKDKIPNIGELLAQDIITPVLAEAKSRHPEVEPIVISSKPAPRPEITVTAPVQITRPAKERALPLIVFREPRLPKTPLTDLLDKKGSSEEGKITKAPAPDKTPYRISHKNNGHEGEDQLQKIIADYTSTLAKNDPRLMSDLELLLTILSKNPFIKGTYNINDAKPVYTNGGTVCKLKSFRGDQLHLKLQHPDTRHLRIVYYVDFSNETVVINDILDHDTFNKKFK